MLICFVITPAGLPSVPNSKRFGGTGYAVDIVSTEGGPFCPVEILDTNDVRLRFFAGKLAGTGVPNEIFWSAGAVETDGGFIAAAFDSKSGTFRAWSDMFLLQRWYYGEFESKIYVSNSLEFLSKQIPLRDIEWNAAPYMLGWGYLPGKWTPLRGVYGLRSGERLSVENGSLRVSKISRLDIRAAEKPFSFERSLPAIQAVMEAAVAAEIAGQSEIVLPLSGGMDSRFLLGTALKFLEPEQIQSVTFGPEGGWDAAFGTRLALKTGVRSNLLPRDSRPIGEILDENFATTEGMYWTMPEYPVKSWRETVPLGSQILSGYIGDYIFGSYERDEGGAPNAQTAGEWLKRALRETVRVLDPEIVRPMLTNSHPDPLNVEADFEYRDGTDWREQYDLWVYENHLMNRTNFAVEIQRDRGFFMAPFIHQMVMSTAYAIPREYRRGERAYYAALAQKFPELYEEPSTSNFGLSPGAKGGWNSLLKRAMRRGLTELDRKIGPLFGAILYQHPRQNYNHPRELYRSIHRDYVVSAIESLKSVAALNRTGLETISEKYQNGKAIAPELLKSLLTLHQWQTRYGKS